MPTIYPAAIDNSLTLPSVTDSASSINALSINRLRDAIIAIEAQLGVKPAGIYVTVRARLDAMEQMIQNGGGGGGGGGGVVFFGDLSGTNTAQTVIGIHNIPINVVSPIIGQTLIFDGSKLTYGTNFANQNILTTGGIIGGPTQFGSVSTQFFNLTGKQVFNAITSSNVSDAGQAIIYYDQTTNKLLVSENGGAYVDLIGGSSVTIVTTNYSVAADDETISINTISVPITITLPSSTTTGRKISIKDANGSAAAHNITISGNGHNIDGASTFVLTINYENITVIFNGSIWMVA